MRIEYPVIGQIVTTHSCHGDVKMECYLPSLKMAEGITRIFFDQNEARNTSPFRIHKNGWICHIEGVDDMNVAEGMRGIEVRASRDDLHLNGELLPDELRGLPVYDAETGIQYGMVSEVYHSVAQTLFGIMTEKGEVLVPNVPEFVKKMDFSNIQIRPIDGMFE